MSSNSAVALISSSSSVADLMSGSMPDHYEEISLSAALDQAVFVVDGDLRNLFLTHFEEASKAYLDRDLSKAAFGRTGEAAMVELETRSQTLQWVLEMMNIPGKAVEYPVGGYPLGTCFAIAFKSVEASAAQVFRLEAKDPGHAIRKFRDKHPISAAKIIGIYVDKRDLMSSKLPA